MPEHMTSYRLMQPSPIQQAIQPVLELFAAELSSVRFPDVDFAVLREFEASVAAQAEAVVRAEEALAEARASLVQCEQALVSKAARALAYARIYAEGDAELLAKIEAIALPRTPSRRTRSEASIEAPPTDQSAMASEDPPRPRRGRRPSASIAAQ